MLEGLPQKSEKDKAAIITCVVNDYDVQYRWGVLADNIIVEEELLSTWCPYGSTIRGFSICKTWMEDYKQICMTNKEKEKLKERDDEDPRGRTHYS